MEVVFCTIKSRRIRNDVEVCIGNEFVLGGYLHLVKLGRDLTQPGPRKKVAKNKRNHFISGKSRLVEILF